jgi:hypothetical protein
MPASRFRGDKLRAHDALGQGQGGLVQPDLDHLARLVQTGAVRVHIRVAGAPRRSRANAWALRHIKDALCHAKMKAVGQLTDRTSDDLNNTAPMPRASATSSRDSMSAFG